MRYKVYRTSPGQSDVFIHTATDSPDVCAVAIDKAKEVEDAIVVAVDCGVVVGVYNRKVIYLPRKEKL